MGLIPAKSPGRERVSRPAEPGRCWGESDPPCASVYEDGNTDGTQGGDATAIANDSRSEPSSDAPDPTPPDGDEIASTDGADRVDPPITTIPVNRVRLALVASMLIVSVLGGLAGQVDTRTRSSRRRRSRARLCGVASAAMAVMLTAATTLAAPASASRDNPCRATLIPICAFVPILPNLDHDVDLTTDPDPSTQTPNDAQPPAPPIDGR